MPQKAAAVEVLRQLPLDVVGEPPAVLGDEPSRLVLQAALARTFEGREHAPKKVCKKTSNNPLGRACWRAGRAARRASAANAEFLPQRNTAHVPAFLVIEVISSG